jgi:hypothetical protein
LKAASLSVGGLRQVALTYGGTAAASAGHDSVNGPNGTPSRSSGMNAAISKVIEGSERKERWFTGSRTWLRWTVNDLFSMILFRGALLHVPSYAAFGTKSKITLAYHVHSMRELDLSLLEYMRYVCSLLDK